MAQAGGEPPERFTRVEYLRSDDKAYINLGKTYADIDEVLLDCQEVTESYNGGMFGLFDSNESFYLTSYSSDNEWGAKVGNTYTTVKPYDLQRHVWNFGIEFVKMDGNVIRSTPASGVPSLKNLYLFAKQDGWSGDFNTSRLKVYLFKGFKNGVLSMHLVPVYDNERKEPCMFDLLTNTPYYNANTEGAFTYG